MKQRKRILYPSSKKSSFEESKRFIEQKLIVSYSIKYRNFQRHIREGQINRAIKLVENGCTSSGKKKQNDPKRFIKTDHSTKNGEVAELTASYIDQSVIENEEKYDGFYAVCTNLDESVSSIVRANKRRWEIEECFRIMKTDFEARPVYLNRQDRILHIKADRSYTKNEKYLFYHKKIDDVTCNCKNHKSLASL